MGPVRLALRIVREIVPLGFRRLRRLLGSVRLEARQDGAQEGVPQEAADGLPCPRLRLTDASGNGHHSGHLAARTVLENLREHADQALPHLLAEGLGLARLVAAHLDVAEERLHVTRDVAVGDLELAEQRVLHWCDAECAVRAHPTRRAPHLGRVGGSTKLSWRLW